MNKNVLYGHYERSIKFYIDFEFVYSYMVIYFVLDMVWSVIRYVYPHVFSYLWVNFQRWIKCTDPVINLLVGWKPWLDLFILILEVLVLFGIVEVYSDSTRTI